MDNSENIKILNFISDILNDDNGKIKLEATDLLLCIKNISDAHYLESKAIMGKDRHLVCSKELIHDKYFAANPLNRFDNVMLNIEGGDVKLYEMDEVAAYVKDASKEDVNLVIAHTSNDNLKHQIKVKMLATKFNK